MHDGEPKYVLDVLQYGDPTKIKNGLSIKNIHFKEQKKVIVNLGREFKLMYSMYSNRDSPQILNSLPKFTILKKNIFLKMNIF